jgi:aryl-alcohol dehydrogenase-like predicted oxidoreductase
VTRSCEGSLKRLGSDRIDLYILHQPDPTTPIEENLRALGALVTAGKVREIGASNFSQAQIAEAAERRSRSACAGSRACRTSAASSSGRSRRRHPRLHRTRHRVRALLPPRQRPPDREVPRGVEPPEGTRLARATPERRTRYANDRNFDLVERLGRFAADHGHTLHELALSWLASLKGVAAVIPGATAPAQARENARATVAWELTPEEMAEVMALVAAPA